MRRGLRVETIKTYAYVLDKFFRIYRKNPLELTNGDIRRYEEQLRKWNKSDNTINVYLSALKFFYENILHKKFSALSFTPRIRRTLPTFLSKEETAGLFQVISNPKHLLMITLLYATGMRVSELVRLKVGDFHFNDNYGWIRDGKGGKDRLFVIAQKLKGEILSWISTGKLHSEDWLFSGYGMTHISTSTVQIVLKQAARLAGIRKNVHPHTLRHSFATHLIENGYAVTEVQPLLGHASVQTTMIYLHMASPHLLNVQSPYDELTGAVP